MSQRSSLICSLLTEVGDDDPISAGDVILAVANMVTGPSLMWIPLVGHY